VDDGLEALLDAVERRKERGRRELRLRDARLAADDPARTRAGLDLGEEVVVALLDARLRIILSGLSLNLSCHVIRLLH
jgi:hypothetical protein